jgi:hypothetical protein
LLSLWVIFCLGGNRVFFLILCRVCSNSSSSRQRVAQLTFHGTRTPSRRWVLLALFWMIHGRSEWIKVLFPRLVASLWLAGAPLSDCCSKLFSNVKDRHDIRSRSYGKRPQRWGLQKVWGEAKTRTGTNDEITKGERMREIGVVS